MEDLANIVLPRCEQLRDRADQLLRYAKESLSTSESESIIFEEIYTSYDDIKKTQFFLDPSVVPEVIAAQQIEPGLLDLILSITTTWCYSLNRTRLKLLGI